MPESPPPDQTALLSRLERTESLWQTLVENAPCYIFTVDRQGVFQFINYVGGGYSREQVIGSNILEWSHPDSVDAVRECLRTVFQEGKPARYHGRDLIHGRWYEGRFNPIVEQGQVILALGINTDIHDLKEAQSQLLEKSDKLQSEVQVRAEQLQEARQQLDRDMAELRRVEVSLQESEFRFRTTVESSPIPIIIVSFPEIIILDANERMAEALRVPRADLIGRHGGQFNADREKNEMLVELVGKQGGVQDVELQIRRADGTLFWGLVSSRLIPYDNQQAIMVSLMDITNIKEHERVLQCERTTLRRLLDLNDRERTLVAYEIHDGIVQQMSGALMFLQAVEDELESAEPRIKKNVDTAAETLRDAVDEARRLIGGLRPHLLEQEGMIRAIESLAEGMSVPGDFEVSVRNELTLKRVAPTIELAIFRIVQEALNNASRHSGSRTADVRLQQTEATISISIRDDGKGFDPAHTPKKRYGVEGIRERARLLGGTAAIESAPGQGTSVTVTLPIQDVLLQSD